MRDPYFYDDAKVLKNHFNIKNEEQLKQAESDFASIRIKELARTPFKGEYDFQHFCDFHKHIFGDIYPWAGEPRTIDIEKEEEILGWLSIDYTKAENIEKEASAVLKTMTERDWKNMNLEERATHLSNDMAALWKVHAFREGNTRTTNLFVIQFAESRNIPMDRKVFSENSAWARKALVAANAIFADGDFRQSQHLHRMIKDSLVKGEEKTKAPMTLDDWKAKMNQKRTETNHSENPQQTHKKSEREK